MSTFLIRGGSVIDGSERLAFKADVQVIDGVIANVGQVLKGDERGKVIDGSDLTITPGFIDMHAHSDLAVISDPNHLSKVTQGVTLEVVGQDGLSYAPTNEQTQQEIREQLFGWNGNPSNIDWGFKSIVEYLDYVDKGAPVNVAFLIPHGNVRMLVKGSEPGIATANELSAMQAIVEQGMREGAVGLSAGLTYTPAMYADDNELIALNSVVAKFGGYYAPHHRNYGRDFLKAVSDCIEIAQASRAALHLTHCHMSSPQYHGKTELLFDMISDGANRGVDITLDTYPYLAGMTYLHALLPSWVQAGGIETMRARLREPEVRRRVMHELMVTGSDGAHGNTLNFETIVIAGVEKATDFVGMRFDEAAKRAGKDPVEFYLDFLDSENYKVSAVLHGGHEPNVRSIMKHSRHMVGSDGILVGNRPHPRGYGTFARYLGVYGRDEQVLTFEGAVARMTGRPAQRLRLVDRGLVKVGYRADLVLLHRESVIDRATYEQPRVPAAGFVHVWIDGISTLWDGSRTDNLPGRAVRLIDKKGV